MFCEDSLLIRYTSVYCDESLLARCTGVYCGYSLVVRCTGVYCDDSLAVRCTGVYCDWLLARCRGGRLMFILIVTFPAAGSTCPLDPVHLWCFATEAHV